MKQTLIPSRGLASDQLQQIGRLAAQVNRFDGLTMKVNWSELRQRPQDELNEQALQIYRRCGFAVKTVYDYYRLAA